jgi:hypothetical protein
MLDLKPIKDRLAQVAASDWSASELSPGRWGVVADEQYDTDGHTIATCEVAPYEDSRANAVLIAHAKEDLAALVAEVERLRDVRLTLKDALQNLINQFRSDDGMSIEAALHAAERVLEDA